MSPGTRRTVAAWAEQVLVSILLEGVFNFENRHRGDVCFLSGAEREEA